MAPRQSASHKRENTSPEKEDIKPEPKCASCEDVCKYEKLAKIGHGTFGEVFKARHRRTKKIVALKKILTENEKQGFPITALREIRILRLLNHENIVHLIEICIATALSRSLPSFYLVFEFCDHDLAGLISNINVSFTLGTIKMVMKQLLNGLFFIHAHRILHRDLKTANILITKSGILKLADFGLARFFRDATEDQPNTYTNKVVTLWYRPPELLLGDRNYGPPVDLWGAGCIMAEMWTRSPIMQGKAEQEQLILISLLCGGIRPESYPGCEKLELYNKLIVPKYQKRKVKQRLKTYIQDDDALDLLDKLLVLDPKSRIDSDSALDHDFFWKGPFPCSLEGMLSPFRHSMFEYFSSKAKHNARYPGVRQPFFKQNGGQHRR
ncbi:cyclin-dependent kinase 9 [Caerostris extrusa]|uniref:Cyclin-dependent kinase 9 n=1 Tax=Caerostris extrusa TaxID=172846 RepID=A0AAV4TMA9_CAEEX|nr:cyclin-dependent kinase 9 [Caerostris extrusa]